MVVYDVLKLCTAKYTIMPYKQSSTFDVWCGTVLPTLAIIPTLLYILWLLDSVDLVFERIWRSVLCFHRCFPKTP